MTDPIRSAPSPADRDLPLGAHLVTPRLGFTHHGIHVGGGRVVHYAGFSRALLLRGPVEEVTLAQFAGGRPIEVKPQPRARYAPERIVARARSRLGEDRYRLTTNNCEHFCEWCISGESRSEQVESVMGRLRASISAVARFAGDAIGAAPATPVEAGEP
jgi:hypothetical protein